MESLVIPGGHVGPGSEDGLDECGSGMQGAKFGCYVPKRHAGAPFKLSVRVQPIWVESVT